MPQAAERPRPQEQGTALLLVPALFLILMMATALVVDGAIAFSAKRELAEAAAAAANDAAAAIDDESFYQRGELSLNPALAQQLASASLARRQSNLVRDASVTVTVTALSDGAPAVHVVTAGTTRLLFARFLPDRASSLQLHSTARAVARRRVS